jgi:hypothetical protein
VVQAHSLEELVLVVKESIDKSDKARSISREIGRVWDYSDSGFIAQLVGAIRKSAESANAG